MFFKIHLKANLTKMISRSNSLKWFYADALRHTTEETAIDYFEKNGETCSCNIYSKVGLIIPPPESISEQEWDALNFIHKRTLDDNAPFTISQTLYQSIKDSRVGKCYYPDNKLYRLCQECFDYICKNDVYHACTLAEYWSNRKEESFNFAIEPIMDESVELKLVQLIRSYETIIRLSNIHYDIVINKYIASFKPQCVKIPSTVYHKRKQRRWRTSDL